MDLVTPQLGLIFWQTITFLIVFILLAKFAWNPILSGLKERELTIEESLESAKKAKEEMSLLKSENEKLLVEARQERDKILKMANETASQIVNKAKDEAQTEANKQFESAKASIINEKNAALREVENITASLSLQIAEKILKKELTSDASQLDLVKQYIKETHLN